MADIYRRLEITTCINAAGTVTRLSGSLMSPDTVVAMVQAAQHYVRIDQLQAAVGGRIAQITGAEAGLVTAGASAGLTLAAAACLAGFNLGRMDRLPDSSGMPCEIVVPRSHRNGYDHALRAAGARIVEVGLAERTRDPQPWEIEAAIGPQSVALAFADGFSALDLQVLVEIGRRHRLPVIVDASASLPPQSNLQRFIAQGADLVVFSGGKAMRGPQASGILCGRRDLIASAAMQSLDMDWAPPLWNPPAELIPPEIAARGVPNHGIGRGMKVGKEEIVGLWAALEQFVALDEASEMARLAQWAAELQEGISRISDLDCRLLDRPGRWPIVEVQVDSAKFSASDLVRRLEEHDPCVQVGQGDVARSAVTIDPFTLQPGEVKQVIEAFHAVCIS
jgi:L-seryl-tRNA(Ser) seleniumtransferase